MSDTRLDTIDLSQKWDNKELYEESLEKLQNRVRDLQTACYHNGQRVIIVLEGWDASGKGGLIRRLTGKMDPRSYRVHPIEAPNELEEKQHYLRRFWKKIPPSGHIAVFDRSWYGRVLVERIENYTSEVEWHRAYDEINQFEKLLTDDGVVIVKLLMHISQDEQLKRYLERLDNPHKHWKLTEVDLRNRENGKKYQKAYEDMLYRTDTENAPWFVIAAEHKWFARTSGIEAICEWLEAHIDTRIPVFSEKEIAETKKLLGV